MSGIATEVGLPVFEESPGVERPEKMSGIATLI